VAGADNLRARTKRFAFEVVRFVDSLPRRPAVDVIARQLIRAATSVPANHRAAGRARSQREFVAKLGLVLEEADECEFWLDALRDSRAGNPDITRELLGEASQLRAIFATSINTFKARHQFLSFLTTQLAETATSSRCARRSSVPRIR
jgi:four helix bundle protein